ncbi:MAG TPA: glycosyltransferase 87 family protein [Candidatus Rubrimentiphilum sp.]|nr:glycosyltransferase 87 family protein [Candidatus Rubrimentiphilum sp.]
MRKPVLAALVIAACALLAWQLVVNAQGRMLLGDFRAFYCGGSTLLHGANPYNAGPLLHCEQVPQPFGLHTARDRVDLPAPFPGYALALFAIFALLPYPIAAAAWFVLLLASTALACAFTARLIDRPPYAVLTLLAVAFSVAVIPYGELAPIIFAALAGGALALRRGIHFPLVLALAVIALLPHVALPVFLALFMWNRAARLPVAALCVALAAIDLAIGGPQLAVSYFTRVLPNHAASEIGFITQYSMTWFAQGLGAPDRIALAAGNVSYLVMAALGVWLGGAAARAFADRAFLLLVPAALAVTFGSFIHYSEITLAFPAALLLYARTRGIAQNFAAAALFLVALPWQSIITQPALVVPVVAGTIAIALIVLRNSVRTSLRIGLGAALFCSLAIVLAWHLGPQTAPHAAGAAFDPLLAEASWARHISDQTSSSGLVWWVPKLPTWIGLVLLALCGAYAVAHKDDVTGVVIEHAPART